MSDGELPEGSDLRELLRAIERFNGRVDEEAVEAAETWRDRYLAEFDGYEVDDFWGE